MFKRLKIIFNFWLFLIAFPGNAQDNFKVFIPEFIPENGSFEISLITSKVFADAEKLELYILPEASLFIKKADLWTSKTKTQILFSSEFTVEFSTVAQKASIDLRDTTLFTTESFFRIVISLKSDRTSSNTLKVFGNFFGGGKILGQLISSDDKVTSDIPSVYNLTFNYYDDYSKAEYAALFNPESYLNIPLVYNFEKVLVAEWWIKFKDFNSTFLKIINWETNMVEYYLSVDENQMLNVTSQSNELLHIKPCFISQDLWYHISFVLDKPASALSFLCNSVEFAEIETKNYLTYDNLLLHFQNEGTSGSFYLDQFRLEKVSGSLSAIERNRNYSDYVDDSSAIIIQIDFSETELISLTDRKIVSYENIKMVRSDSPIFPRAPAINLKIMNNYYEVDWTGGDFHSSAYYILERAVGNGDFQEVGKETAVNSENYTYSLIIEKYNRPEIDYFRIKQVNKDGTKVYSDVVKVGQGTVEDVVMGQNYPNPFNPTTQIEFELLQDSDVEVKVYNLEGQEIALMHKGFLPKGLHQFKFDASGMPSGIYLFQVTTPLSSQTRKIVLTK